MRLFERDVAASAGRFSENGGSVVLYRTADKGAARALVNTNPYLRNGSLPLSA